MVLAALLVLAQAAGNRVVADAPDTSLDRPARSECAGLTVSSPQARSPRAAPAGVPSFAATRILDLRIASRLRRLLEGKHVLQLKVYTPRGHLYQTLTTPFADREGPDGGRGPFEVTATLPVGGTAIMSNSLYGVWRVEAFLDGDTKPCGPTANFEIKP